MNAFVTGSQKYGKPKEDSDTDLCVLVSPQDLQLLTAARFGADEEKEYSEFGPSTMYLKFGKLHVLATTNEEIFSAWKIATQKLTREVPASRDRAIEVFKAMEKVIAEIVK